MTSPPTPAPLPRLILAAAAAAVLAAATPSAASAQESGTAQEPATTQETVTPFPYPRIEGRNLNGEEFRLPGDLPGEHRLLLIPFHQWQQEEANTWLARLPELADSVPGFRYFEQPTLAGAWRLMRRMIDGGMRSGIPDLEARARTITVFLDRGRFLEEARIPDTDHITVFLLDTEGRVVWRARGPLTEEAWASLEAVLGG